MTYGFHNTHSIEEMNTQSDIDATVPMQVSPQVSMPANIDNIANIDPTDEDTSEVFLNPVVTSKTSTADQKKIKQERLSSDQWDNMETTADPHLRLVLDVMRTLGESGKSILHNKMINSCGEDYVTYLRNRLIDDNLLPFTKLYVKTKSSTQGKKGGGKKHRQASLEEAFNDPSVNTIKDAESFIKSRSQGKVAKNDIIRINVMKILEASYEKAIGDFNKENYCDNTGFRSNYIEFRMITLMLCINHAIMHKIAESECFELAIATDRIIVALAEFSVSPQLVKDIVALNKRFKDTINFSHKVVCEKYPRMLFPTKFDGTIPMTSIKAYPNQIELIDSIKRNNEILILLQTMIGGGKTTIAGALAVHVQQKRILEKASYGKEKTQLLFVCSVAPVREQVGKIVWNMGIGLAIATLDSISGEPKITKNYNCDRKDEKIVVILSDISSALILLKNMEPDNKKYIVLFDEPTVGADQPNHPITNTIPHFLKYSPEQFILCSATIPNIDQIPKTVKIFTDAHPNAMVKTITSKTSYIGCEIVSFDGVNITPHANCKTADELRFIIKRIDDQPFIGRLYTAPIVYKMHSMLTEAHVPNIPNIETYFNDVRNHAQSKVQELAIILLNCLIQTKDNNLIEALCVPMNRINIDENSQKKTSTETETEDEILFSYEDDDQNEDLSQDYSYDIHRLVKDLAHKHRGGCLVATKTPINTGEIMYKSSFEGLRLKNLLSKYETQKKLLEVSKSNIDKQKISDDDKAKQKQELEESNNPTFEFPEHLQINTWRHIRKNTKKALTEFDTETIRAPFNFTDVDFENTYAPEWLLLLLYAGAGVYDPDEKCTDKTYLDNALRHAENGRLAYLVAGHSIAYGTNFPLSDVIAEDELCEEHSMNTLFQLINRAGRVGRSWVARAYLGNKTINRISDYIHGIIGTGTSEEAINMELAVARMIAMDALEQKEKEQKELRLTLEIEQHKKEEQRKKVLAEKEATKHALDKPASHIISLRELSSQNERQYPTAIQMPQWGRSSNHDDHRGNYNRDNNRSDARGDYNRNNNRNDARGDYNRNNNRNDARDDYKSDNSRQRPSYTVPLVANEDKVITMYKQLKGAGKYIPMHIKKDAKVIAFLANSSN